MVYSLTAPPMRIQKKFPGNIGEGINREADVNIKKKTIKMSIPLTMNYLLYTFFVVLYNESDIAIFNKSSCLPAQHKYKSKTLEKIHRRRNTQDKNHYQSNCQKLSTRRQTRHVIQRTWMLIHRHKENKNSHQINS